MLKADAQTTRERIVDAAIAALKEFGFAGASARAIARRGGFNQALIFYHFGSVADLLLAALDHSSQQRLARYRAEVEGLDDAGALIRKARELYREDLEGGHITILNEMLAGAVGDPQLGSQLRMRMRPWLEFAEEQVDKALAGAGLSGLLPRRPLATALLSLYIGFDLLATLGGDGEGTDEIFDLLEAARVSIKEVAR